MLDNTETLPWMVIARSLVGTKEYGRGDNPVIMQWAELADIPGYSGDDIPWCGLFVAHCLSAAGIDPIDQPLWARNWAKFGTKLDDPAYGAVMVFVRNGGGHVGFYVGEQGSSYLILGGNQSDSVNVSPVSKSRLMAVRYPTRFVGHASHSHPDAGDVSAPGTEQ